MFSSQTCQTCQTCQTWERWWWWCWWRTAEFLAIRIRAFIPFVVDLASIPLHTAVQLQRNPYSKCVISRTTSGIRYTRYGLGMVMLCNAEVPVLLTIVS